jgi:hypothetical protein
MNSQNKGPYFDVVGLQEFTRSKNGLLENNNNNKIMFFATSKNAFYLFKESFFLVL